MVAIPPGTRDHQATARTSYHQQGGKLMKGIRTHWPVLAALAALTSAGGPLRADDLYNKKTPKADTVAMPRPAEVQALAVHPAKITLKGADASHQLILTATLSGGRLQDLTGDVKYEAADPKVARVTTTGRVLAVGNGTTQVTASYGDRKVTVPVTTTSCDVDLP